MGILLGFAHVPAKPAPDLIRGSHRFADKDARQSMIADYGAVGIDCSLNVLADSDDRR
jgi:hypothetical protein